ncbi:MAG: hypothetical protein ACC628_02720 [Pirellulaceae bacterium]
MKTYPLLTVFLAIVLAPVLGIAQEPEETEKPRANRLPEPLDEISSNIKDIEKAGYFAIIKAEYGRTEIDNEEALIWTLTTIKPITYRHAGWLIRRFRDVRFYDTPEGSAQEVLAKLMYFSQRISDGAVNNDILSVDDQVKIWVPLDREEIRLLRGHTTDKAVFRTFKP